MRKFLIIAMLSIASLGAAAASAAALTVTVTPGGAITATSLGLLRSQGTLGTLECNVTLIGSLRSNSGTPLFSIGSITNGTAANCRLNGSPTTVSLTGFPWTVAATSATTTASRLFTILGVRFVAGGGACTYSGSVGFTAVANPVNLLITLASLLTGAPNPPCGTTTILAGQGFALTPAQTITIV